jgi:hypothetical protein
MKKMATATVSSCLIRHELEVKVGTREEGGDSSLLGVEAG